MRISESCVQCLYDKQKHKVKDETYLREVRKILDNRREDDSSPYMVYLFNQVYEKQYGKPNSYAEEKKKYNDLVLSMESEMRKRIAASEDPVKMAFQFARIGNYIDFGAMNQVDSKIFMQLFDQAAFSERDQKTYRSFLQECADAETFLLLADNCGEIVLDKMFIEELKKRFPQLQITVMVRGAEILNDATMEDAQYVGLDQVANLVSNGKGIAGTMYEMLTEEAKRVLDSADIVLSKGQGNYESLSGQGRHVFYAFLCKCDLFTQKFQVPRLTGMFVEEKTTD